MVVSLLLVACLPALVALTFGTLSGPVLGAPLLTFITAVLVFRVTPGPTRIRTRALSWSSPAPLWSRRLRGVMIAAHASVAIWAMYQGLVS
jgi:hypothetical protein